MDFGAFSMTRADLAILRAVDCLVQRPELSSRSCRRGGPRRRRRP